MKDRLMVKDNGIVLEIGYEDMIKYHGRFSIAGVALAFKGLELSFKILAGEEVPDRKEISFFSALGPEGQGVIDGVEMITRARTSGRMVVDTQLDGRFPGPPAPQGGSYYFEVAYGDGAIGLTLKKGLIPEEFMFLCHKSIEGCITDLEANRLQEIKEGLASQIILSKPEDIYDVSFSKTRIRT